MSNCSGSVNSSISTAQEERTFLLISGTALVLSAVLCLIALVLVFAANLHKNLVYRLSLYQVFSTLTFTAFWVTYLAVRNVDGIAVRGIFAILSGCSVMVTLMTTTWMVLHLFALAVFNRNLKRLEPLCVASAILIPLCLAGVVFATLYTAIDRNAECPNLHAIDVEWIAGYGMGCAMLAVDCFLVFVMGATLCSRAFGRTRRVFTQPDPKDKKVLFEMIPLLIYPVLLLLTMTPVLVDLIIRHSINYVFVVFVSSLSIITTVSLILHVGVVLWNRRQTMSARGQGGNVHSTTNTECASLCNESLASSSGVYQSIPVEESDQIKVI
eukprot:Em0021g832a